MDTATYRNGCYNHKPYAQRVLVQDGFTTIRHGRGFNDGGTRAPRMVWIDNPMSKECDYTQHVKTNGDPGCTGCIWKTNNPTIV